MKNRISKATMRKKVGKIEKGIRMPKCRRGDFTAVYPFAKMKIGDSFLVRGYTTTRMSSAAAAWVRYNKSKFKFASRKWEGGARVWRIK